MQHDTKSAAIHSRAMLVRVSISAWDGRRFDRKVTDEVTSSHGAAKQAGRFNKHLLGGRSAAPSHARAIAAGASARVTFYAETLPWADEGWRLLPTANYERFTDAMRARRGAFDQAADAFLADFPALKEAARVLLNGMFLESDYPAEHELRSRFGMEIEYAPVPAAGDFRLDLPADQLADIERTTAARVERATADAMRSAWDRLRDSVRAVRVKLADTSARGGKGSIFRDSLIGNVRETCDILARLNVTGDAGLERMRVDTLESLAGLDPEALRENPGMRAQAVRSADSILATMSSLYGGGR